MAWVISNYEPVYVDDDPRPRFGDCAICPLTFEECDRRKERGEKCYWDEIEENYQNELKEAQK